MTKGPAKRDMRITLRLTAELYDAIKAASEDDRRSMSDWIVLAAEQTLGLRPPVKKPR